MSRQKITEESGIQKTWAEEAAKMTMDNLPGFLRKLTEDYEHDYGTICHAIASAAVAAAWAVERTPQGGITGFQAGCIMWKIIGQWGAFGSPGDPLRLQNMNDLLYPQYANRFQTISPHQWDWVRKKAKENLASRGLAADEVIAHWKTIFAGKVPFGLRVEEENDVR